MKITIGKEGCKKTWQAEFPEETKCVHCGEIARIGFVAYENLDYDVLDKIYVGDLHENGKDGKFWLHDVCAVAIYFCNECAKATALYNQG